MVNAPPWMELAYQLAQNPSSSETRLVKMLPELLANGASVLEISRRLGESPETVSPLLERLASAEVVSKEGSGMSAPFSSNLYYLRSEGVGFFKYLSSLSSSSKSVGY